MITNFPLKPDRNQGGNRGFTFIPVRDIQTFPLIYNSQVLAEVIPVTGKTMLNGYATPESLNFSEIARREDEGIIVETTIKGFTPGHLPELLTLFYEMERTRFVVITADNQGKRRLVGSPRYPLQFIWDFESGEAKTDRQGLTFRFTGLSRYKAPVYEVIETEAPPPPPPPPPPDPVIVPITYTMTEGDGADFLENNLLFNIGANYADGIFNEGSGTFSMAYSGETVTAQQNYYGGELDGNGNIIAPWPYPVTCTLQLYINGVLSPSHNLITNFPANQPAGGLQSFSFIPTEGNTYAITCHVGPQ